MMMMMMMMRPVGDDDGDHSELLVAAGSGGLKIHGSEKSMCVARVLLCLAEKGLHYDFLPVDIRSAAHKRHPYLSLNPFGQIPAFQDEEQGLVLFESRAISKYIARKYKDAGGIDLLRMDGSLKEWGEVEAWMEAEAHQFHPPARIIIHQLLINPTIRGVEADDEVVEAEAKKLERVLDVYEQRLSTSKYLAGDGYTLADLHHVPLLVYLMKTSKASLVSCRPHVVAWWNDISARPASLKVSAAMDLSDRQV